MLVDASGLGHVLESTCPYRPLAKSLWLIVFHMYLLAQRFILIGVSPKQRIKIIIFFN